MATKLDEKKAFKILCETFREGYCTLDFEMRRYSSNNIDMGYRSYAAPIGKESYWSQTHNSPIEAVNDVLSHFDKERE